MKKLLGLCIAVGIGFVLGLSLTLSLPARAGIVGSTATANGDTNGDGNIDISDAVYLLNFLFTGGHDIAEIKCAEIPARSCLVATGQRQCYGDAGPIACNIAKARGQDGFYQLGCPPEGRFLDNGDGTVTDNCTGLMWTKVNVDVDGDGEIVEGKDQLPWLAACQFAADMTYLEHDDWRVPNAEELLSITDLDQTGGMGAPLFPSFDFVSTWSSTHVLADKALGFQLRGDAFECSCCAIPYQSTTAPNFFAAVRGP